MSFNAFLINTLRVSEADQFGTGGRTVDYRVNSTRYAGGTRRQAQELLVSAGASNVQLDLTPVSDAASGGLFWLETTGPLDVRLSVSTGTMISQVLFMTLAAVISTIFVTNTNSVTSQTVRTLTMGGGSAAAMVPVG